MHGYWRIFRIPLLLAALNVVGLLAALVGDGVGDAVSWVALGIVVWAALAYRAEAPRRRARTRAR